MLTVIGTLIVVVLVIIVWNVMFPRKIVVVAVPNAVESFSMDQQLATIGGGFSNTLQRRLGMGSAADSSSEQFRTPYVGEQTMMGGYHSSSVLPI